MFAKRSAAITIVSIHTWLISKGRILRPRTSRLRNKKKGLSEALSCHLSNKGNGQLIDAGEHSYGHIQELRFNGETAILAPGQLYHSHIVIAVMGALAAECQSAALVGARIADRSKSKAIQLASRVDVEGS
ncbi:uncharacterized protein MCYG_08046 [Microsporum canis CBS 113480]|uniref:Uncharacterized protein n=1 Tax=Arthroderma otae (strain ATCC MYA-4605 / CBS 113480) TaxID=554155 RepID=C5FZC4_ARTOC|nr:uncharacterized protein MCYG_08046 [Microsporum canis CBS 113480]EEQ35227.1 predicted protein [Microsporum canis CBS 113480]